MCGSTLLFVWIRIGWALAQTTSTTTKSQELPTSKDRTKIALAVIVSGFLIVTIIVVFVVLVLTIRGKSKKKREKTLRKTRRRRRTDPGDTGNDVFAARGQAEDPKRAPDGSGSFVFSGQTMDKPIPRVPEDSYAAALNNNDASESLVMKQRPIELVANKDSKPEAKK